MCGICGIFSFGVGNPVDTALIQRMTDQLVHRGPDDAGFYISGDQAFGLGVRRLKIVDADGSHQPITNESSRLWIGCNGEIYNYRSLREQLASNHRFSTDGDVEPILHLYEEFGVGCVDHLRGMFAFALWDNNAQRLLLAVDRFGKKPMYYALDGQKIVFASELKALLQVPGIRRDLDIEALDEYLACGYITAPRSIYLGIRKLPPGHLMSVRRDGNIQFEPYWQPQFAPPDQQDRRSLHDLAAELRALLLESVRLRMMDGAGAFLSGGVDSSAVVALMREVTSAPIKAFSIAFEEPTYDESAYARAVADDFGVEHFVEYVPPNALDLLPKLVKHFDEPFADASMLPTYVVSRLAHQHVRVVLSGDGGDEVFGGYHQHLYGYRQQILGGHDPAVAPFYRRRNSPIYPTYRQN